jgi:hypothetical protein
MSQIINTEPESDKQEKIETLIDTCDYFDVIFLYQYDDYIDEIYDLYENNVIPTDNFLKLIGFVCDYYYNKYSRYEEASIKYIKKMLKYTKIGIENGDPLSMFVLAKYEYFYTHDIGKVIKLDRMALDNGFYCGLTFILEHLMKYKRYDVIIC